MTMDVQPPAASEVPYKFQQTESVVSLASSHGSGTSCELFWPNGGEARGVGASDADVQALLAERRRYYGSNLALFYPEEPLVVGAAEGCRLYTDSTRDETRSFLDCINNVSHVGHCNTVVARAVSEQLVAVNTNSRYLSPAHTMYAAELTATLPDPLSVLYLLSTGSEANELALRIARTVYKARGRAGAAVSARTGSGARAGCAAQAGTQSRMQPMHVAVMDHAYHGHTCACMELSPYKFDGPGGEGRAPHVHVLPCPDVYRGQNLNGRAAAEAAVAAARAAGGRIGAFFAESIISCGGQVTLPPGYLAAAYEVFRAEGAVCVADEVQSGFGRVGEAFWAFEPQGVVPDIVTMGKPMGNGYPISGLVTSRALADEFAANSGEFFATYGGSNAAVAAGRAVLREIRERDLQAHAREVGGWTLARLRGIQARYPGVIGDVRGTGLMLGLELVTDEETRCPSPALAAAVRAGCRARARVLLSAEGPWGNVIKIKPALVFSLADAACMCDAIETELDSLAGAGQLSVLAEASRQRVAGMVAERAARE